MNKVVLRLRGGLGNQLFMIAFVYYLFKVSESGDACFVLDNRAYDKYKIRKMEVTRFFEDSRMRIYDKKQDFSIFYEITRFLFHCVYYLVGRYGDKFYLRLLSRWGLFYSKRNGYDVKLCKSKKCYVYGYFQDSRMVLSVLDDMKKKLKIKPPKMSRNKKIAVSVRCGQDYVTLGWPLCGKNYFKQSVEEIVKEKYSNQPYEVLIFSDNVEIAKSMDISENATYVQNVGPIEQMAMLMNCDDFVLSNSSFSWWGGTLGKKDDSIVIAPDFWYNKNEKTENTYLFYPQMRIRSME